MVIKKQHAILLEKLLLDEEKNLKATPLNEVDQETAIELEVMGLIRYINPENITLTYCGKKLAYLLRELYEYGPKPYTENKEIAENIHTVERWGISKPENWQDDFCFLGSEIITLLECAKKAGMVGPEGETPLIKRGLAVKVYDREKKKEYAILTEQGEKALEIYLSAEPKLNISYELAEVIRSLPMGPVPSEGLLENKHMAHLLEGMRLIALSPPDGSIFTFTALGQAVKKALTYGGFGEDEVLSEDILITLTEYLDTGKINQTGLSLLQSLGYVSPQGEILPAGEWAIEAYRLFKDKPEGESLTFDVEEGEVMLMQAIQHLWEKAKTNYEERPTFENLRKEMIERRIREYKHLLERYGRKIEEMPEKYREIARRFQEAKVLSQWYDENFDLRADLHSLESLQLVKSTIDKEGKEVFELTKYGKKILKENIKEVTAQAVKAITISRKQFSAPHEKWYEEAKRENLVGSAEPTRLGYMFAEFAEKIERLPFLTKFDHLVFATLPEKGMNVNELIEKLKDKIPEERIKFALNKLEARRLIEILPDGNIVETPAGVLMDQALSSVPSDAGVPVTPLIVRMLRAIKEVGSLYVKEEKVRILPSNWKQVMKKSGLAEEIFVKILKAAKALGYIGNNSLNKSGLALLKAVEEMNRPVSARYKE